MTIGRCCCGATRITVTGEPRFGAVCHCDDCRRRSGSAFGWSAYFPDAQAVGPEGEFAEYSPQVDAPQVRYFCRRCGTTVAWRTGRFPGLVGVACGIFADDALPEPLISNRSSACLAWVTLPAEWRHIG